jgi:hypothetical protein
MDTDPLISEITKPNGRILYSLCRHYDGIKYVNNFVTFLREHIIIHIGDGVELSVNYYETTDEMAPLIYRSIAQKFKLYRIMKRDLRKYNMILCIRILFVYMCKADIMKFIIVLGKDAIDIYENILPIKI